MKTRIVNDVYPTDAALTSALLDHLDFPLNTTILEPCYGNGDMAKVLRRHPNVIRVYGTDINGFSNVSWFPHKDATTEIYWDEFTAPTDIDWVVTNPPFNCAEKILPLAWDKALEGVAMLLRLSYLEPTKGRGQWLQDHADQLRLVMPIGQPRPSFREDGGTDTVTTCWFVWDKSWSWAEKDIPCPYQFLFNWK